MINSFFLGLTVLFSSSFAVFDGIQQTIIPAYMYPGVSWDTMKAQKPAIIIANPSSGPGTFLHSNYKAYISKARNSGSKVSKSGAIKIRQITIS